MASAREARRVLLTAIGAAVEILTDEMFCGAVTQDEHGDLTFWHTGLDRGLLELVTDDLVVAAWKASKSL